MRRARKARFREYHSILLRGLSQVRARPNLGPFSLRGQSMVAMRRMRLTCVGKMVRALAAVIVAAATASLFALGVNGEGWFLVG